MEPTSQENLGRVHEQGRKNGKDGGKTENKISIYLLRADLIV